MSDDFDRPITFYPTISEEIQRIYTPDLVKYQAESPTYSIASSITSSNGTTYTSSSRPNLEEAYTKLEGYQHNPNSMIGALINDNDDIINIASRPGLFPDSADPVKSTFKRDDLLSPLPDSFYDAYPHLFMAGQGGRIPLPTPPTDCTSLQLDEHWRSVAKYPSGELAFSDTERTDNYSQPSRRWTESDPLCYSTLPLPCCAPNCNPSSQRPRQEAPVSSLTNTINCFPSPPERQLAIPQKHSTTTMMYPCAVSPITPYSSYEKSYHSSETTDPGNQHPYLSMSGYPYYANNAGALSFPECSSRLSNVESKVVTATPRRYKCTICVKRFTRPSSLATHMHSHTGEKPYKCMVENCGRRFSVVSNLRRHAKIHVNHS